MVYIMLTNTIHTFFTAINSNLFIRLLMVMGIFLISCSTVTDNDLTTKEQLFLQHLEAANIEFLDMEKQEINDFTDRFGWDMKETGSGLHYLIYTNGDGVPAEIGKTAVIQYNVYLLNGELIYSSDKAGNKHFRIGQGGVESGLEEAILLLRVGDEARFIMPAHLAHGVPGDGHKIPGQAAIVYELKLLELIVT